MPAPTPFLLLIRTHSDAFIVALLVFAVVMTIFCIALWVRLGRLNRLYQRLTRGTSGGNIEDVLQVHMNTVRTVAMETERLKGQLAQVAERQQRCIQRVGLVRFDAFDDVGGQQSFAVVLLDAQRNGAALSSVYSRQDVRVYAKAIHEGQPSHPLSREEQQAMALAEGS
jgi:hypothetical protein